MQTYFESCMSCLAEGFCCCFCCGGCEPPKEEVCDVGIELDQNGDGEWVVKAIQAGGPADTGLIAVGDKVESIDFKVLKGMRPIDVKSCLQGKEESVATIELINCENHRNYITIIRVKQQDIEVHAGLARLFRNSKGADRSSQPCVLQ